MIPFNKPYLTGKEMHYMYQAVYSGKISGNGNFTKLCHTFFQNKYDIKKCLLTTSCTDALEMAAILCDIKPDDEVIIPSFTFVSTVNAFVLRGAKIIFADSRMDHPGIDEDKIEELITKKTKVIVVVHYAGISCDMDKIMTIARNHNILVVEDAAQAIDSFYTGIDGIRKPLGSIGDFGAFSFHETKNISSGEGGLLLINNSKFFERSEIVWEKGTNRSAFFRGEISKYGWVDIGSSFLPSEITAAFLFAQLENIDFIQAKRITIWNNYYRQLKEWAANKRVQLASIPPYATNNAHMFYLVLDTNEHRTQIIEKLRSKNILAVFHYQSLHKSEYFKNKYEGKKLSQSEKYSECLLRLPLFFELSNFDQQEIIDCLVYE